MIRFFLRYLTKTLGLIFTAALLSHAAMAEVGIGLFIDGAFLKPGQTLPQLMVSGYNTGTSRPVDVHIGLIAPDNTIYEYPDWNTHLRPWLSHFILPANFHFPATAIELPQTLRTDTKPGVWYAAAALTEPGTMNLLALEMIPFAVTQGGANSVRYGVLSLSIHQSTSGIETQASGIFYEAQSSDLASLVRSISGVAPQLDQCVFNEITLDLSVALSGRSINTLDAGPALTLLGNGEQTIPKSTLDQTHVYGTNAGQLATSYYQGGTRYRYQGPGGTNIAPFVTADLPAPPPLQLFEPALSLQSHPVSQNLLLKWQGQHGVGEVIVSLSSATLSKIYSINCRFVDDGTGEIPAALLNELKSKLATTNSGGIVIPGLGEIQLPGGFNLPTANQATLSISRSRYTLFNTVNRDLHFGTFGIYAGASLSFRLE